jgi:chromosome partitioning protein
MGRIIDVDRVAGVSEVARHARTTKQVIDNWRHRYQKFPKPIKVLRSGPLFDLDEIDRWLETGPMGRRNGPFS